MNLFVTAIGTDSGKTLASAVLTEALEADYWKPVQAGYHRDTETVATLLSNTKSMMHAEAYLFSAAMSPHVAAKLDGVEVDLHQIKIPINNEHLVVEGAGGVMVPLNDKDFVIDIASFQSLEVVLVSNLYLGSINHTLLTINELNRRNLRIKGIIFNGPANKESMDYILEYSGWEMLLHIPHQDVIDKQVVCDLAEQIRPNLFHY
jgi:dethiobiotin synthetase